MRQANDIVDCCGFSVGWGTSSRLLRSRFARRAVMFTRRESGVTAVANLLRKVPGLPNIVHLVRRLRANIMDRMLNIYTVPPLDLHLSFALPTSFGDATEYQAIDYILLSRYIDSVRVEPD